MSAIGSSNTPVFVDANGVPQQCGKSLHDIAVDNKGDNKTIAVITIDGVEYPIKNFQTGGNAFRVIFADWNYDTTKVAIKTEPVLKGGNATAPNHPDSRQSSGYDPNGWSPAYTNVQQDLVVLAQYKIKTYTVRFFYTKDGTSTQIGNSQTVEWGKPATAPAKPTFDNYTTGNWDKDFSSVKSNLDVYVPITKNQVEVTFQLDGGSIDGSTADIKRTVDVGTWLHDIDVWSKSPSKSGWNFTGWDKDDIQLTSNYLVTAQYEVAVNKAFVLQLTGTSGNDDQTYYSEDNFRTLVKCADTNYATGHKGIAYSQCIFLICGDKTELSENYGKESWDISKKNVSYNVTGGSYNNGIRFVRCAHWSPSSDTGYQDAYMPMWSSDGNTWTEGKFSSVLVGGVKSLLTWKIAYGRTTEDKDIWVCVRTCTETATCDVAYSTNGGVDWKWASVGTASAMPCTAVWFVNRMFVAQTNVTKSPLIGSYNGSKWTWDTDASHPNYIYSKIVDDDETVLVDNPSFLKIVGYSGDNEDLQSTAIAIVKTSGNRGRIVYTDWFGQNDSDNPFTTFWKFISIDGNSDIYVEDIFFSNGIFVMLVVDDPSTTKSTLSIYKSDDGLNWVFTGHTVQNVKTPNFSNTTEKPSEQSDSIFFYKNRIAYGSSRDALT